MVQAKRVDFRLHDWIDGKYKVERVLAHGRHDSKFKVVDRQGNQYMLKLLNLWQVDTARQTGAGVKTESEILSCTIPSHYLTQIVGNGSAMGNPYIVTQFYRSSDLSKARQTTNVAEVITNVLYGLRDLHQNGKVYGNLTAENVLLTDDGRILLTNYVVFGNRNQAITDYTQSGGRKTCSSLAFAAPERFSQERSASLLPTVDIYAAGVLTYYLLTGRYPFGITSNMEAYRQRAASGQWNRSILGREHKDWETFIDRTLSPDPYQRPLSVDEALALIPGQPTTPYTRHEAQKEVNTDQRNGMLLRLLQGEEYGKVYRLGELFANGSKRILTLGRQDNTVFNQIQLKESGTAFISRRHATIELDSDTGKVYIRNGQWDKDAENNWATSLNGTYLNSAEVTQEGMELTPGDIISIGGIKLRVEGY